MARTAVRTESRRDPPPLSAAGELVLALDPLAAEPEASAVDSAAAALDRIAPAPRPAPDPPAPRPAKTWPALGLSLVIHAAFGLALMAGAEAVRIAGSEEAGIVMLGDGAQNQAAAGDAADDGAITVTFVTVMTPERPAELQPETLAPAAAVETVGAIPAEPAVRAAPVETLAPSTPTEALAAADAPPLVPPPAEDALPPAPADRLAAAVTPDAAAPVQAAPAALLAEPVPARESVPAQTAVTETLAPSASGAESFEPASTAAALAEPPVEVLSADKGDAAAVLPSTVPVALADAPEPRVAEALATLEDVPMPSPRPGPPSAKASKSRREAASAPEREAAKPDAKTPRKVDAAEAKPRGGRKGAADPRKKAGNKGKADADARRGAASGKAEGTKATAGKAGKNSAAGNAAVSNYPGKVAAKLRRSLRYPAEARRQRLRGEAVVGFTVNADGGVRGARLLRSSGSAVLDKAALDAVQRAAPFPSIPKAAGRAQWGFEVPLAFTR